MKNLLLLATVLSALVTSDVATARMGPPAAALQLLLPAQAATPVLRQASFQLPASTPGHPHEPGPYVLLSVAIGLVLLRMGSRQRSEKFKH